jgi:succinate-semialdehyde dehydrogenase/glutarate-semialdehyde dehydrogenase
MTHLEEQGRAMLREHALIAGEAVTAAETIAVDNPADGSVIGRVPKLSAEQVERAVRASVDAFPAWAATPGLERAAVLRRWADAIDRESDGLAALLSLENGKPFSESKGEIAYANQFVRWFAGEAERLTGDAVESWSAGDRILAWKDPVGPVAAITPWNFPAAMVTRKLAPAFAAGCTVVLKPASATPFTAIALAALAYEAGLPPAALSVVTGASGVVGGVLTASPLIRKLSFTGSTPVGQQLMADCAPTLKRLSMELGGAAPALVFDDADLPAAVEGVVKGKFRNTGQSCVSINRCYVQRGVLEAFVDAAAERVRGLKVGSAFEEGAEIGPLIDKNGLGKVEEHVAALRGSGARLVVGGERHARGGLFFQPTLLAGGDDTLLRGEETFGPVLAVFPFEDEAEALRLANATDFGLASYVFAGDLRRVFRVARGVEAGMVGVNTGLISNAANPFGGIKLSGFGREGSRYGLDEYLQVKAVTLAGVR